MDLRIGYLMVVRRFTGPFFLSALRPAADLTNPKLSVGRIRREPACGSRADAAATVIREGGRHGPGHERLDIIAQGLASFGSVGATRMSDVVVVGTAAAGTAIAHDLARAHVTLVERGPTVAVGCRRATRRVVRSMHVAPLASRETVAA
jgi:hypothetical protein